MPEKKTSPARVSAAVRQSEAIQMRIAGYSYDVIAEQLGYANRSCAYKAVMTGLRRYIQEPAEELREIELDRLDALWQVAFREVSKGNLGAIDYCLRIMKRRADLLGLDAPAKQELSGPDGTPPVMILEVVRAPDGD